MVGSAFKPGAVHEAPPDTFREDTAPELASHGHPANPDLCRWTAVVPVTQYWEYRC